jgi:hypothetical protein
MAVGVVLLVILKFVEKRDAMLAPEAGLQH